MKPFALSSALNVFSTSLSLPNTVKNTLACDKSFVKTTSVIVIKPTRGSLTYC